MDTRVTVTVFPGRSGRDLSRPLETAFGVFADLERQFSLFRTGSEISAVNAAAGRPTTVSKRFAEVLGYALELAAETGGVFDPLVGRLTAPGADAQAAPPGSGFRDVRMDPDESILSMPAGSVLDLNSVVKGLALDLALEAFGGDEAVMIEAGGDIILKGLPPGKAAWDIGIRDPFEPRRLIAVIPAVAGAVCTSGDYFRTEAARAAGRGHLVNGRNGLTAGDIVSMTVLAPTARQADALSTAAYFLPPDQAADFVEHHERCACFFIDGSGQVLAGAKMRSILTAKTYA